MRFFNNITRIAQGILYVCGISIHNNFTDECVPDFSCCNKEIHSPINKRLKDFWSDLKRMLR
jgi:hypothetical protein|nr:MAG TPA: hypothetical protein [Caudoviricetes sp.]